MSITKTKKKFTFDVGWVFASSVIILLLHFLQKPALARYLGPDGFGLFSMAITIGSIILLIALFGIDETLVKFVAEYKGKGLKDKVDSLTTSAFITTLIIGLVTSLALFFSSNTLANIFNMPSLSLLLKIYAFAFPFLPLYGIITSFFNGLREMKYYAFIRMLQASLALAFIIAFLMIGLGAEGAMLGTVFAIIGTVGVAIFIMKKFVHFTLSDYKKNTKKLASFGSRLVGANMTLYIFMYIDTLMIGYFLTSTEVGYYEAATSLSRFFWLVPNAIGIVAYPAISEYWAKNDFLGITNIVDKATKYSACALTFAGMMVIFFAKDIVTFIFSPEFLPAVLPLTILIIGTVTYGTLKSLGSIFAGMGRPGLTLKITAIGAFGNVFLNMLLIPQYGIIGAATATTSARIFVVIIAIYFLRKAFAIKFDFYWYIKLGTLAGIVTILFYTFGFLNHYISATVVLIFYAVVVTKHFLKKEDREYFVSIANHILHVILRTLNL